MKLVGKGDVRLMIRVLLVTVNRGGRILILSDTGESRWNDTGQGVN
jgi:hypothetical protein